MNEPETQEDDGWAFYRLPHGTTKNKLTADGNLITIPDTGSAEYKIIGTALPDRPKDAG